MKIIKKSMLIVVGILVLLVCVGVVILQQEKFGKHSTGERLKRIQKSPNYRDHSFQNIHHTPDLTEGASYFSVLKEFIIDKKERNKPEMTIPSIKTNLKSLNPDENLLVWFGHSSYFIQVEGTKIVVDPVFSGAASPFSFTTNSFEGTDIYSVEDFPKIDFLIITHDHWDHLDYETVLKFKEKVTTIICGLGVGEHLESWGFPINQIIELDWKESHSLTNNIQLTATPARHFSGRGLKRNQSLWCSYVLKTTSTNIYIGGDSGYDTHFKEIGAEFGPFDYAILENGQYDKNWRYIHMMPEEVAQAALDLNAKNLFPVHSSKFALGNHAWDEPLNRISKANTESIRLITPKIGELVTLSDTTQIFSQWWK